MTWDETFARLPTGGLRGYVEALAELLPDQPPHCFAFPDAERSGLGVVRFEEDRRVELFAWRDKIAARVAAWHRTPNLTTHPVTPHNVATYLMLQGVQPIEAKTWAEAVSIWAQPEKTDG